MTAGMGDVVIAPLYQALRRRGVEFEFFHRVDALHLDDSRQAIDAITMGRQVRLADGVDRLRTADPGRAVCPSSRHAPLADQIQIRADRWPRIAFRPARRRRDPGAAPRCRLRSRRAGRVARHGPIVGKELIDDRPEWRDMTTHVRTVATQAFQLWLRPDRPTRWAGTTPASRPAATSPRSTRGRRCRRRCGPRTGPTHDRPHTVGLLLRSLETRRGRQR